MKIKISTYSYIFVSGPSQGDLDFVVFLMFSELRWKVIVHFVDIDGIYYHHCLNFLFIIDQIRIINLWNKTVWHFQSGHLLTSSKQFFSCMHTCIQLYVVYHSHNKLLISEKMITVKHFHEVTFIKQSPDLPLLAVTWFTSIIKQLPDLPLISSHLIYL